MKRILASPCGLATVERRTVADDLNDFTLRTDATREHERRAPWCAMTQCNVARMAANWREESAFRVREAHSYTAANEPWAEHWHAIY